MLSSDDTDVPDFCEEILDNTALYHYQDILNDSSVLATISSLQTESPCLDMIKHYLCFHYYPVCNPETGELVQLCSNNCKLMKDNSMCSDLMLNVTTELKLVGVILPKIECSADDEITTPCFDIFNGKN